MGGIFALLPIYMLKTIVKSLSSFTASFCRRTNTIDVSWNLLLLILKALISLNGPIVLTEPSICTGAKTKVFTCKLSL